MWAGSVEKSTFQQLTTQSSQVHGIFSQVDLSATYKTSCDKAERTEATKGMSFDHSIRHQHQREICHSPKSEG